MVLGKNVSFVCPLLYALTYFIRCNELFEVKLGTRIDEPVPVLPSLDERVCG